MARKASRKGTGPRKGRGRKRDYAAEYAKRTAGTRPGSKERQRARGHAPPPGKSESQVKRERLQADIEAWADKQATKFQRVETDPQDIIDAVWGRIRRLGVKAGFRDLVRYTADLNARYRANKSRPIGINLDSLAERWELPPEYLGYH